MDVVQFQAFMASEVQRWLAMEKFSMRVTQLKHTGDKMGPMRWKWLYGLPPSRSMYQTS